MDSPDGHVLRKLLRYLRYPDLWWQQRMYPDSYFSVQLEAVLKEFDYSLSEFLAIPDNKAMSAGSEHYRAAVIYYWLSQHRTAQQNSVLADLLRADPDRPMGRAFLRELLADPLDQ